MTKRGERSREKRKGRETEISGEREKEIDREKERESGYGIPARATAGRWRWRRQSEGDGGATAIWSFFFLARTPLSPLYSITGAQRTRIGFNSDPPCDSGIRVASDQAESDTTRPSLRSLHHTRAQTFLSSYFPSFSCLFPSPFLRLLFLGLLHPTTLKDIWHKMESASYFTFKINCKVTVFKIYVNAFVNSDNSRMKLKYINKGYITSS